MALLKAELIITEFNEIQTLLKENDEKQVALILSDFANAIYYAKNDKKKDVIKNLQLQLMQVVDVKNIHRVIPIEDGVLKAEIEVTLSNKMLLKVENAVPDDTVVTYEISYTDIGYELIYSVITLTGKNSERISYKCPWQKQV